MRGRLKVNDAHTNRQLFLIATAHRFCTKLLAIPKKLLPTNRELRLHRTLVGSCVAALAVSACSPMSAEETAKLQGREGTDGDLICVSCSLPPPFPDSLKRTLSIGSQSQALGIVAYGSKLNGSTAEIDGFNSANKLVASVTLALPSGLRVYGATYQGITATASVNTSSFQTTFNDGRGNVGTYNLNKTTEQFVLVSGTAAAASNAAVQFNAIVGILTDVGELYLDDMINGTTTQPSVSTSLLPVGSKGGSTAAAPMDDKDGLGCYDTGDFCSAEYSGCETCANISCDSCGWDTGSVPVSNEPCNYGNPITCMGLGGTKVHSTAVARAKCNSQCSELTSGASASNCSFVGEGGSQSNTPMVASACVVQDLLCASWLIGYCPYGTNNP